jgi:hypothetical protein
VIITDELIATLWFATKCLLIGTGAIYWFTYVSKKYVSAVIARILMMIFKGLMHPGKRQIIKQPPTNVPAATTDTTKE